MSTLAEIVAAIRLSPRESQQHFVSDTNTHVVILPDSVDMVIMQRDDTRTLRQSVEFQCGVYPGVLKVAVNGSYGRNSGTISVRPRADYGLGGWVVVNGRYVAQGESDSINAYLVFTRGGERYHFGKGNTPQTVKGMVVAAGLSALLPVASNGRESTSAMFRRLSQGDEGRTLVGHDPDNRRLMIVVQNNVFSPLPDLPLAALSTLMLSSGCRSIVGLDGSTSSMLRCNLGCHRSWVVENVPYKNNICANAVAFFGPR